jgi:autotransporter translocation and assembly factor TamB
LLVLILALVVVALGVATMAFRNAVALAIVRSIARGYGYDVTAESLDVGLTRVTARSPRIRNAAGEPVLDAREIVVDYSLRDLLPGGKRLFGLHSVTIATPHVTVIHHPNGSYNITLPPATGQAPQPSAAPLDMRILVSSGSVLLDDRFVDPAHERRVMIDAFRAAGMISPRAGSYYHAGGVFIDADLQRYPIRGDARFDDPRGFELQHWTAARLPIAALANFALSTHAFSVEAGELRDLDLKIGALATPAGSLQQHIGLSGRLTDGRFASPALTKPVRDARASFVVDADGATVRSLDAELNGIALHASGSMYDFAAPQIAFGLTAHGDASRVRALVKETANLPLAGPVALHALAEGSASNPLIIARVDAPHVTYGTYRLDAAHGFAAVSGSELDVVSAAVRYGTVAAAGRAVLQLAPHTRTIAYVILHVPSNGLPYVDNIVPGMPLEAVAIVRGTDARLAARGYLRGTNGADRLDAPFSIGGSGSGAIGPIVLQRRDGASLYARAAIDRTTNQTVAVADIRGLSLLPAPAVTLPGLALPAIPSKLDGKLDLIATALVNGKTLAAARGVLHGYGAWGDVRADADGSAQGFGARGRLTSSFDRLTAFTGNLGASGGIDVPFALSSAGRATILQIDGARFPGARIRGIALGGASATLGLSRFPTVDVYAADVRVAGRNITATGRFGAGGTVQLTGDLDLGALHPAGVGISGGHATVIADIGGTVAKPTAGVVAAFGGARYADADLGGNAGLVYDGSTLRIDAATLTIGGSYAGAQGTVAGLVPGHIAPRYDLDASVEDADIATLARTFKNSLRYPEGTVDAGLHVSGGGMNPSLRASVRIPEGSINGLDFSAGQIGVSGNRLNLAARDGRVTVGTTTLRFGGTVSPTQQSVRLRSDRIDLADFNDYFDEAEVLAGTGSAALALNASMHAVNTMADVTLRDARYRRFDLGAIDTHVATAGTTVQVRAGVDGSNGRANLAGSINVPAADPLRDLLRRAVLDLHAQIAGVNLGTVIPAAGYSAPILGTVDGSATVSGRYPALSLRAQAALTNGVVGRIPIDRFTLAATAANGRGRLTRLQLDAHGLSASGSGTFGLRPQDPFDLRLQASSPNINELIATATGKNPGVRATLTTTTRLSGTAADPHLATSLDVADVTYSTVTIPALHAELDATRRTVDVRNGMIVLPRGGSIAFDARAPLGGGVSTPIALDFAPHHVDVNAYSSLLPDDSVVDGVFDGNVGVRGTLLAPRLNGALDFRAGSFRSNSFKNALTAIAVSITLSGTSVRVTKFHAHAAPGNIDGSGMLALRDLRDPIRGLTTNLNFSIAGAYLSLPKYYTGYVDGTLGAHKNVAAPLSIDGDLTFANARIPYTALLPGSPTPSGAAPALPNIAFDIGVKVGRDVRVQSGPVDIGTTGAARLGGTLASPTLDGQFTATDGTVSLYRTFTVQNGSTVSFEPSNGVTPNVDATAVTNVPDPPTNVLLHVTGLADHLHLAFSSEPPYDQQQILGLLVGAQALGAVSGVAQTGSSSTNGASIAGIGEGLVNTQLTQKFLEPFSSALGGALGLSDLNLNYNLNGAVSATARRRIGKNVSFTYGEQIGGPAPRTSVGIVVGTDVSGAQLTLYQAAGSQEAFGSLTPFLNSGFLATTTPNYTLQAIEPPTGSGFVFSYQRRFW